MKTHMLLLLLSALIGWVFFDIYSYFIKKDTSKQNVSWQQISFPTTIECGTAMQFDGRMSLYVRVSENKITGLWGIMAEKRNMTATNFALHSNGLTCSRIEQTEASEEYKQNFQDFLDQKVGKRD